MHLLESIDSLKHRTMLTAAYAAGLRVSEAIRLKVTDIARPKGRHQRGLRHDQPLGSVAQARSAGTRTDSAHRLLRSCEANT
jgi:hypothetical protein